MLVGEAKWARRVNGDRERFTLERKAERLPSLAEDPIYAIAAREQVTGKDILAFTATEIFAP